MSPETQKVPVEVEGRTLTLTNLDKVLYPETGFTKGQVIDYYRRIAPVLLPHIAGRPLTLKRYPDGVHRAYFYEKNAPSHRPDWVPTARIASPGSTKPRETVQYVVAGDLPTLVWAANLADLEIHTPMWRLPDIGRARPACLRPGPRPARDHRRLLPRRSTATATARADWPAPAGEDLRRQGHADLRGAVR